METKIPPDHAQPLERKRSGLAARDKSRRSKAEGPTWDGDRGIPNHPTTISRQPLPIRQAVVRRSAGIELYDAGLVRTECPHTRLLAGHRLRHDLVFALPCFRTHTIRLNKPQTIFLPQLHPLFD